MIPYPWSSALIALCTAGVIVWLVRRSHLHPTNATWWLGIAAVIMILGLVPGMVDFIARLLGISYPPVLAVVGGIVVALVKLLKMDIERAREQQQLRMLAQKVSVLEAELRWRTELAPGDPGASESQSDQVGTEVR